MKGNEKMIKKMDMEFITTIMMTNMKVYYDFTLKYYY